MVQYYEPPPPKGPAGWLLRVLLLQLVVAAALLGVEGLQPGPRTALAAGSAVVALIAFKSVWLYARVGLLWAVLYALRVFQQRELSLDVAAGALCAAGAYLVLTAPPALWRPPRSGRLPPGCVG